MKREDIYVGMRVKVKKSSRLTNAVGQYATVIGEPYDGYKGVYVHCLIDGDDDVWTFEDCNIKVSDEKPVVGDRIVVVRTEQDNFFKVGASGLVTVSDFCGDGFLVKFDSGDYRSCSDDVWAVSSEKSRIAIVRDVK